MKGLVPEEIRVFKRQEQVLDRLLLDAILGPDRERVESLPGSPETELRAHVRDEALQRFARPPAQPDLPWAWRAWRLASVELWLRRLRRLLSPTAASCSERRREGWQRAFADRLAFAAHDSPSGCTSSCHVLPRPRIAAAGGRSEKSLSQRCR